MCLDWPVGLQFAAFDLEYEPTNSILQANFTCQLFLYNLQAKDGFDIFKWLGEKKKEKQYFMTWKVTWKSNFIAHKWNFIGTQPFIFVSMTVYTLYIIHIIY